VVDLPLGEARCCVHHLMERRGLCFILKKKQDARVGLSVLVDEGFDLIHESCPSNEFHDQL
jgi:hypothetical protein